MPTLQVSAAPAERDLRGAYDAGGNYWAWPEDMPADAEWYDADGNVITPVPDVLPCAQCGHAPHVYAAGSEHYVECRNDDCATMPSTRGCPTERAAVTAWNTRAPALAVTPEPSSTPRTIVRIREHVAAALVTIGTERTTRIDYARAFGAVSVRLEMIAEILGLVGPTTGGGRSGGAGRYGA